MRGRVLGEGRGVNGCRGIGCMPLLGCVRRHFSCGGLFHVRSKPLDDSSVAVPTVERQAVAVARIDNQLIGLAEFLQLFGESQSPPCPDTRVR